MVACDEMLFEAVSQLLLAQKISFFLDLNPYLPSFFSRF